MERNFVSSTNVRSIGFLNGVLEVEFRDGSIYQYVGVSQGVYTAFMNSSSKGSFVHQHLKGRYPASRIR